MAWKSEETNVGLSVVSSFFALCGWLEQVVHV
jgi:hypothetical protein